MKTLALLVIHVLTTLAQRAGPGGARAIIAESVLLKHQQLIARRSAGKTPKLTTSDRFLCGFLTLFMRPRRIRKAAIVLKPATLTKFRRALVSRNVPSSLYEKRSANISMATAISHAENENYARKSYCQEELRTLIAA